jgi:hypothetical protein
MRAGLAIAVALATSAAPPPAQTPAAPVVVAGVPVTMAQARERAGSHADGDRVIDALGELTPARWVGGEAKRRGVRADARRGAPSCRLR